MNVVTRTVPAVDLKDRVGELAELRIKVFREWPYLYEGTVKYEEEYLETYLTNPRSRIVLAESDCCLVGMSTCLPLVDEVEEFRKPLIEAGYDADKIFYFGESVLLPEYRGQGVGKAFMEGRFEAARLHGGMTHCCFCAVIRDSNDPRKPDGYRPLNPFWEKMGFKPLPGVTATFDWQVVGETEETPHQLGFWIKEL